MDNVNAVMHQNDSAQVWIAVYVSSDILDNNLQEPFSQVCVVCLFPLLFLILHPSSGDEGSHFTCFINFIANNIFHYGLLLERILQSAHDSSRPKLLIK